jgi:hypothetical protein
MITASTADSGTAPMSPPLASPELPGLLDLVLRGRKQLTALIRDETALPEVVQRLLALSLLGMGVHGLVVGTVAQLLRVPDIDSVWRMGHPMVWAPLAFMLAFVGALGVCLPTFYFHTQLAGLDASFRLVTAQALRAQAVTSVLILGVLPFYAAIALGVAVGLFADSEGVIMLGAGLPFLIGLFGIRDVYRSFGDLAETLPVTHRRRGNFLRRMVLLWGAVYSAVAPVALYRLIEAFSKRV